MVLPKGGIVKHGNAARMPCGIVYNTLPLRTFAGRLCYLRQLRQPAETQNGPFFYKKKGQKRAQKPDGQTHSVVTNSGVDEENESEEAANKNQHKDTGEGTSEKTAGVTLPSKKRKIRSIKDEHRKFHDKWTD